MPRQVIWRKYEPFQPVDWNNYGPTVRYDKDATFNSIYINRPCFMKKVKVSDNCLDCPLSVCRFDDLRQAQAEVLQLKREGKL